MTMLFGKVIFLLVTLLTFVIIVIYAEPHGHQANDANGLPGGKTVSEDVWGMRSKRQAVYKARFPNLSANRGPDIRQGVQRPTQNIPVRYASPSNNNFIRNTYRVRRPTSRSTKRATTTSNPIKKRKFKAPPIMF